MADGVLITAGDDTTIATDDVAGTHFQRVKLVDGTLNGTEAIPGTAARGLLVDVPDAASIAASVGAIAVTTDSWDDGDGHAMVAPIDGQLGVEGGSGVVTAKTQRVVLATDVAVNVGSHAVTNAGTFAVQEASAAAIAASLSVVDDWDETDRAKVNPIAGQAGVQGASGTVTALTQRVVLATDVALPAGTNAIGKLAANSGVDIGDVDITSIAAGDNNIGNVDIVTMPNVTIGTMAALVAGSAAIGKLAANSGVDIGDVDVTSLPAIPAGTNKIGFVGDAPGATVVTAQVTPTASAATLVASRATRTRLTLYNGTNMVVFVGPATVTTSNGFALPQGAGMELDTTALLQCIVGAGTLTGVVYVLETAA